jgi:hypothetical protein
MLYRVLPLSLVLLVGVAVTAALADKPADKPADNSTVTGTVASVSQGQITITDDKGKDWVMNLAKDATIQCDGKACKLDDLKKGNPVTLTVQKQGDDKFVTKVDAKSSTTPPKDK